MMPRSRIPLLALLLPVQVATAQAVTPSSTPEPAYVAGIGQGQARVAPDRATLTLVVETRGESADAVAAQDAVVQRRVLDTLGSLGYDGDRIAIRTYAAGPRDAVAPREKPPVGYAAHTTISVRITDLAEIGALIDAALARGATRVERVAFASSRADSARRAAVADAAANARADAQAVARTMGGSLGAMLQAPTGRDLVPVIRERPVEDSTIRGGAERILTPPAALEVHAMVLARWQFRRNP